MKMDQQMAFGGRQKVLLSGVIKCWGNKIHQLAEMVEVSTQIPPFPRIALTKEL